LTAPRTVKFEDNPANRKDYPKTVNWRGATLLLNKHADRQTDLVEQRRRPANWTIHRSNVSRPSASSLRRHWHV